MTHPTSDGIDLDLVSDYASYCFAKIGNMEYAYFLTNEIIRRDRYYDIERIIENSRMYYICWIKKKHN